MAKSAKSLHPTIQQGGVYLLNCLLKFSYFKKGKKTIPEKSNFSQQGQREVLYSTILNGAWDRFRLNFRSKGWTPGTGLGSTLDPKVGPRANYDSLKNSNAIRENLACNKWRFQ